MCLSVSGKCDMLIDELSATMCLIIHICVLCYNSLFVINWCVITLNVANTEEEVIKYITVTKAFPR